MRVVLSRPEVRNAFNDELIARLSDTFASIDKGTRVIVISGEGETFCAGGDLQWMRKAANYTFDENVRDATRLAEMFKAIAECPAVVVAAVQGAAFGGGCGLVAAADIAIASDDAKFAFSEVRLGLIPATISPLVIPKIGAGHARALFVTGEAFSAEHALRVGLVHEVVPKAGLDAAVERKVKLVLAAGPGAIQESKRLIRESPMSAEEAARRLATARASLEGREGVAAFLEKRKPTFFQEP